MEEFGGKYIGFMHELHMWVGLKRDALGQFDDYGEGLKTDCPEFFSEDRDHYTGPDH